MKRRILDWLFDVLTRPRLWDEGHECNAVPQIPRPRQQTLRDRYISRTERNAHIKELRSRLARGEQL